MKNKKNLYILLSIILLSLIFSFALVIKNNSNKGNIVTIPKKEIISKEVKLVNGISWRPYTSVPKVNSELSFVVAPKELKIDSLEFQLWEKLNNEDWKVAIPFTKWSSIKYSFKKVGIYNLQIDIRNKKNVSQVQKIWLGQFYTHNENAAKNNDSLIRKLISNYSPSEYDVSKIIKPSIYEINLSVNIMYWEYKGYTLKEKVQKLKELKGIKVGRQLGEGKYKVYFNNQGKIETVDLTNNTIKSKDILIDLNLYVHDNVKKVFEITNNYSEKVNVACAITYLLYVNYDYSQVPYEFERPRIPLYDVNAHCRHYAEELYQVLKELEYNVEIFGVSYNRDGIHYLNEIVINKKTFTLDPTSGVFYPGSIDDIVNKGVKAIKLPQIRKMDFLWSEDVWKSFIKSKEHTINN